MKKIYVDDEKKTEEHGKTFTSEEPLKNPQAKAALLTRARNVPDREVAAAANILGSAIEEQL